MARHTRVNNLLTQHQGRLTCNPPVLGNCVSTCEIHIYVSAAGLWASNSQNTSVWSEWIRLGMCWVVSATRSITVMEYYFYLWAGTRTNHTERWQALSSLYSLLLGCRPFGFPIMLTLKTGVRYRSRFFRDMAILARYGAERNKVVYFLRISKVPGVGPGEELHGTASDCDY